MRRATALLVAALGVTAVACRNRPDPYMPSEWRDPTTIERPSQLKSWLKMNDAKAPMQFVKDIRPYVEGGVWRWTGAQPAVIVAAPNSGAVRFAADIAVPEITMKQTGPVTIAVLVNGHQLTSVHYDTPGDKRIEKPVPPAWLRPSGDNLIEMNIDKTTGASDGTRLGFVLTAVGLIE